ncbi:MAG: MATE family efflux transporter [Clostridia bacterium]|nr:MATE family efflux transporter [Clostridia bacterium]
MEAVKAKRSMFGKKAVDMTEGSVVKHLIKFAIPIVFGSLLQQLYNIVDTWVVGNYVSDEAFSAVGTVSPIIYFLISFSLGFATGTGVVVAQYFGAKEYGGVKKTVHTAIGVSVLMGLVLTVVGILLVPSLLNFMGTPENVFDDAEMYLSVYFSSSLGLVVYNVGAGILRAIGDTRSPSYFVAVTAIVNTVLDLVFVLVFDMGVFGVGLATAIAQFISAILVIVSMMRTNSCIKLDPKKIRIEKRILSKILRIGLPSGIQVAIGALSNVFVQAYINYFGMYAMGGWTAFSKIEQFAQVPFQAIAMASTTFVGQNLGSNNVKRVRKGATTALFLAIACTTAIVIPLCIFAPSAVTFFNKDTDIISYGALFIRLLTPMYFLVCINNIYEGAIRAAGRSGAAMAITVGGYVVFRQIYLFVMKNYISNTIIPIVIGYPAGWMVCTIALLIYYNRFNMSKGRLVEDKERA